MRTKIAYQKHLTPKIQCAFNGNVSKTGQSNQHTQLQRSIHMTTSQTLNEIQASPKQYFGLAGKFAYLLCESQEIPQVKFNIIRKRCLGVLYSQFPASSMTRGKAQELFETAKIPAFLTKQVKVEDMKGAKAPVKVKAVKKVTTKRVAKAKVTPKPKAAVKAVSKPSELEQRMTFVEGEISRMSEDVLTIKSGLETLIERLG